MHTAAPIDTDFEWFVWPGYCWVTGTRARTPGLLDGILSAGQDAPAPNPERFLVMTAGTPTSKTAQRGARQYKPLRERDYNGLFATFASLGQNGDGTATEDEIVRFALKYGSLVGTTPNRSTSFEYRSPAGEVTLVGEPLSLWHRTISQFHTLLEIAGQTNPKAENGEAAWWTAPQPDASDDAAADNLQAVLAAQFFEASRRRLAYNLTAHRKRLAEEINLNVFLGTATMGILPIIQMEDDAASGRLFLRPTTLLDALTLQFAEAVCSCGMFRLCNECQETYFRLLRKNRGGAQLRTTCSHACAQKAARYDDRQIQVKAREGMKLSEIARHTGQDVDRIRRVLRKRSVEVKPDSAPKPARKRKAPAKRKAVKKR